MDEHSDDADLRDIEIINKEENAESAANTDEHSDNADLQNMEIINNHADAVSTANAESNIPIPESDEPVLRSDEPVVDQENEDPHSGETVPESDQGQDALQTESYITIVTCRTKTDDDSFFHAVFGEDHSGTFEAERSKDMREEWHNSLHQFTSLQDPSMPAVLREQLKIILKEAIDGIVSHPLSYESESCASTPELCADTDIEKIGNGITKELAESATEYFLRFNGVTNKEYDTEPLTKLHHDSEDFYKIYLDSIKSSNRRVLLDEIPILASLGNLKISVYVDGIDELRIFKPNAELLGIYKRNSVLWGARKKEIVQYTNCHFSRARVESVLVSVGMFDGYSVIGDPAGDPEMESTEAPELGRHELYQKSHTDVDSIPNDEAGKFQQFSFRGRGNTSRFEISSSEDGKQYIVGNWKDTGLTGILNFKLICQSNTSPLIYTKVQNDEGLLTTVDNNLIARARIRSLRGLYFTGSFATMKAQILNRLELIAVIENRSLDVYHTAFNSFTEFLKARSRGTTDDVECAEDFLQINRILENSGSNSNPSSADMNAILLNCIASNKHVSVELKDVTKNLLHTETALCEKNRTFPTLSQVQTKDLFSVLCNIRDEGMEQHKMNLLGECPTSTSESPWTLIINNLPYEKSIYVSNRDIQLFSDLEATLVQQKYPTEEVRSSYECLLKEFLESLRQEYMNRVDLIKKHDSLKTHAPLTTPVYLYLYRSFQEFMVDVCTTASILPKDFFINSKGKWALNSKSVIWPVASPANRVLEQQCRFIFKLMKDFQPGLNFQRDTKNVLQKAFDWTRNAWKKFSKPGELDIAEDRLIWLSIVDDAMNSIKQGLPKNLGEDFKKLSDPLLAGYRDFIQQEDDNFESFRTTAHSIVKLAAQMSPNVSKVNLASDVNERILEKQVLFISNSIATEGKEKLGDYFASLVVVLNDYWELNESIVPAVRKNFFDTTFKFNMESISTEWKRIQSTALTKAEGRLDMLIDFMRAFEEFVEELKDIKFEWFVKRDSVSEEIIAAGIVEMVDNKLSNGNKASYVVRNPESFVRVLGEEKKAVPPHQVIRIVQDMLATVNTALEKEDTDNSTCLNSATLLLSAMRSSFLYFKEQPDYLDFNMFYKESTQPFVNVLEGSTSPEDIRERITRIKESFWYIRKQDEIGIEDALALFEDMNDGKFSRDILQASYEIYLKQFTSYVENFNREESTQSIITSVRELAVTSRNSAIDEWTPEFKKETLPALLAGLAAVWCIRESKDIASTGKSLKPHCVQIICILRLLSVDTDFTGVEKHLAQVSTGQGKSLVLGLLSCILALVGYKVRVVCYSDYLSSRDEHAFGDFLKEFEIGDKITYGTFGNMAEDILTLEVDGRRKGLRELVSDRILEVDLTKHKCGIKDVNVKNTILLIDEVDVFFSEEFYGNTYDPVSTVRMPMLLDIQSEIWRTINAGFHNTEVVVEKMQKYAINLNEKAHSFLSDPRTYSLLRKDITNGNESVKYSNRSLYDEHLKMMVKHALNVFNDKGLNKRYLINEDGIIAYKNNDGRYVTHTIRGYHNVFNYFRLKGNDYDDKLYRNFGYFIISCGAIAYAKLPEEYPLILGVSGTLKGMNKHERATVTDIYKINKNSVMPSYFGHSNLEFDEDQNLSVLDCEKTWLNMIFSHADSEIRSDRSVLIFFNTDEKIYMFRNEFHSKIARLNVLTLNTGSSARERYITEAGVAKTVTLVTRALGRGVDFKSGLTVEKNGGVHVIQTFFSLDEKEETQIKGRTARKDNKGSYELILCKVQWRKQKYVGGNDTVNVDYAYLDRKRKELVDAKGETAAENIRNSEEQHSVTMRFLKSFCN